MGYGRERMWELKDGKRCCVVLFVWYDRVGVYKFRVIAVLDK